MAGAVLWLWRLRKRHTVLSIDLETVADERRRAVQALRETEVIYHSLVETLPQMILRKDLDGRFTFANQRFCAELGESRGDPGQDRFRFLSPRARREVPPRRSAGHRERPGARRGRAAHHAPGREALRAGDEEPALRSRRQTHRDPGHLLGCDRADPGRGAAQGAERDAPGAGPVRNTRRTKHSRTPRAAWSRPRSWPAWVSSWRESPTRSTIRSRS